jgi:hypothetical protein
MCGTSPKGATMRPPLDASTLVLPGAAVALAAIARARDPGLPVVGVRNGLSLLGGGAPRRARRLRVSAARA